MVGPSNFDFKTFKKEIKDDMRQMVRDMFADMVGKMPVNEEDSQTKTVLGKPPKEKLKAPADLTELEWVKDIKRQMAQLKTTMKSHGLNPDFANMDLDLGEKEPFPPKYQFPSMKKYFGTDDPHLYLKQYVT